MRSPSPLPGAKLEGLRLSLNTPVVALERLPVGPASAGIAVHRGPGGARLLLAVRSTRSGQVAFFQPHSEGWEEDVSAEMALEAALSFAEGMGFLFDEDLLQKGIDTTRAALLWGDFLEETEPEETHWSEPSPAPQQPNAAPLLLSKFRFLSAVPAERLLSPPPTDRPARGHFVLRLLSRF